MKTFECFNRKRIVLTQNFVLKLKLFKAKTRFTLCMPEISRFFGIIIQMYGNDHPPPHFHVKYSEYRAIIEIETGEILQGDVPEKQLKFVQVWIEIHKEELLANFETLRADTQTFKKIRPLS